MPSYANYQGFIELTDRRRHKTVKRFNLDYYVNEEAADPEDPADAYPVAVSALGDIATAIAAVTTAEVTRTGVITTTATSEDIGAVGSDVSDEALMKFALADFPGKVWTWGLPAPANIVFDGDNDLVRVSPTQAQVAALSNILASSVYVSDGELIDPTQGTNGLLSGVWRSKQKRGTPS